MWNEMWTFLGDARNQAHLSSWFSALSTFAAVLVALGIAHFSNRRERRRERDAATLMAARITPLLSMDADTLSLMLEEETSVQTFAKSIAMPRTEARVNKIKLAVNSMRYEPDEKVLLALIPLGSSCAHQISRAYALLNRLSIEVGGLMEQNSYHEESVVRWEQALSEASTLLTKAAETCRMHGNVQIPQE